MTIVEKAAYLKGLTEGMGISPDSDNGKLWAALTDLLSDVAHEIEDLQASNLDYAEVLDDISEELSYLEELTCDLDSPEDMCDEFCSGDCDSCSYDCSDETDVLEGDEELEYDGVVYDVECPGCGEEITFDEETLAKGSINCPGCGELLEFELDEEE